MTPSAREAEMTVEKETKSAYWKPPKFQDTGHLRNRLHDHSSAMTTLRPIRKSATQMANRQIADGGEEKDTRTER